MSLTVVSVAYPLAPVGPDSVGGAEQLQCLLDHALVEGGHESIVIAARGSQTAGRLIELPASAEGELTPQVHRQAIEQVRMLLSQVLERTHVDVVHMHGVDFPDYWPVTAVPLMATMHLPLSWYPASVFRSKRPNTLLCCVSKSQRSQCPPAHINVTSVLNGIRVQSCSGTSHKSDYALVLSRICEEKGIHLALRAARSGNFPLLIAGQVFGYPEHLRYYEQEIIPLLDPMRRFIGPATLAQKRPLLSEARCLLVPSLVEETSSLVTMEALASGTPVIAFRRGALPELIQHGRTGFLVENEREMADAIHYIDDINPDDCRQYAWRHFSSDRCVAEYFALYEKLARGECKEEAPTFARL